MKSSHGWHACCFAILLWGSKSVAGAHTTLPLTGCTATNYSFQATLGADQNFSFLFDTASSDIFVASSACDASCSSVKPAYPLSGHASTNNLTTLQYGSNTTLQGITQVVNLTLGSAPILTVPVLAVTKQKNSFQPTTCQAGHQLTQNFQGIIGFGSAPDLRNKAEAQIFSLLDRLNGIGINGLFATVLCDMGGELYLGQFPRHVNSSKIHSTPLQQPNPYYFMTISRLSLGDTDLLLNVADSASFVDSGFNLIELPQNVYDIAMPLLNRAMVKATGQTNFFNPDTLPCYAGTAATRDSLDAGLPVFNVELPLVNYNKLAAGKHNKTFVLTSTATQSYLQAHPDGNGGYQFCSILQRRATSNFGATTFGSPLMAGKLMIYDPESAQIGFANAARCPPRSQGARRGARMTMVFGLALGLASALVLP